MTEPKRRFSTGWALAALATTLFLAVLAAPSEDTGRAFSANASGPMGARLFYDLLSRFGWRTETRDTVFTLSAGAAPIQVLLNAQVGGAEAHALLEHVRRGGSLLVVGTGGSLDDSLPVVDGEPRNPVHGSESAGCKRGEDLTDRLIVVAPVATVAWRRPPPPDTVGFGALVGDDDNRDDVQRAGVGYSMGAGRIAIVPGIGMSTNNMLRRCDLDGDVTMLNVVAYLSNGREHPRVSFDEFHHGAGAHGGSFAAIEMYLGGTGSGRMLAQLLIAGLLLLFAAAPRPLAPRDPVYVARRSPLEAADALARAYLAVNATRTATMRLVAGMRRRSRRDRSRARETDEEFLGTVASVYTDMSPAVVVVSRALTTKIGDRDLPGVATALTTIENKLTRTFTSPAR